MNAVLLAQLVLACTPQTGVGSTTPTSTSTSTSTSTGPHPTYDLNSEDFLATPWPSDDRTDADGHPDLSTFPNPVPIPLVDSYLAVVAKGTGFGTNTPVFLAFDSDIDTTLLPDATESLTVDASIQLVDVDSASPAYGQRVPIQWSWLSDPTVYLPAHALAVAPVFGFPLRPATTYALLVTTGLAQQAPAFAAMLADDGTASALDPLRAWLPDSGLSTDQLAVATVFTTTDPLATLRDATAWTRRQDPVDLSQALAVHTLAYDRYDVYTGSYQGPVFQEGERPYRSEGGGLVLDDDPDADPVSWDDMRMALGTPKDLSHPPATGWPVTIILHGTGGDYLSGCCEGDDDRERAAALAAQGVVSLGIELPLHGTRGGDLVGDLSALEFPFNILNPDSGRSVQRQAAIDLIYLAHALAQGPSFTLPDGTQLRVDPNRISAFGHSQGGLALALAVPFFGEDVQAVVLSGTGGGVAITLLERTDPFPIGPALAAVLQLGDDETLTELHPIAGLVQWLSEVTDPINMAPYWFDRGDLWEAQAPIHVLHFSGLLDPETTYRTAEALAAAGRTPVRAPAATWPQSWDLAGIVELSPPIQADILGFDGTDITAALSQWPEDGHQVLYDNADARAVYAGFLGSVGGKGSDPPTIP
ncbi:MAG: hypothetical protein GXP62_20075 [Oligoflexia bacterium]|nr:hypothetical protein [Oligoflexia bacterium]